MVVTLRAGWVDLQLSNAAAPMINIGVQSVALAQS
jgi:hypothetical protein